MSPYIRAYAHGTIMVIIGCVLAFLIVLAQQYKVSRFMVILVPFLGALVAALAAPGRRFLLGVSLLPVIGAALLVLVFAWNSVALPPMYDEGVAGAIHGVRGMSLFWGGACIVGAAIGWAIKLRRATPPNTPPANSGDGFVEVTTGGSFVVALDLASDTVSSARWLGQR